MSGKSTPTKNTGKPATENTVNNTVNSETTNTTVSNTETESEKVVSAPSKVLTFKIGKKQPPKGIRRGGSSKRSSKYTTNKFLKFAEVPYGTIRDGLKAVMGGRGIILFPHTSGNWADHNGIQHGAMSETDKARFENKSFPTYTEAVAAKCITFATLSGASKDCISYRQNQKLPEGCKTSKPSVKYHCLLIAKNTEDITTAIENINNFNAIPGAQLLRIDNDLEYFTDEDGNINATELTFPLGEVDIQEGIEVEA